MEGWKMRKDGRMEDEEGWKDGMMRKDGMKRKDRRIEGRVRVGSDSICWSRSCFAVSFYSFPQPF